MVKFIGLELSASVPPLPYAPVPAVAGFVTVTAAVPAFAISAAEMVAVSCVELTWLVVWATPPKFITAVVEKFVPVTVKTNAASPCVALAGASVAIVGKVPAVAGVVAFEL